MERLLLLTLDAAGCEAEALLNGIAIARCHAAQPRAVVAVHEFTLAGANRLELVVWPRPAAELALAAEAGSTAPPAAAEPAPVLRADGQSSAHLRLLLPRTGHAADEASARSLAALDWAPPAGEPYTAPVALGLDVTLPVGFPRWRWTEAPPVASTPALRQAAGALLQQLAEAIGAGDAERVLGIARLRTEELAAAYQLPPDEVATRLREHIAAVAASAPAWLPLPPEGPLLRPLAGGRLLECLDATGAPALRTAPNAQGESHAFPLRLAAVDHKLYVLR